VDYLKFYPLIHSISRGNEKGISRNLIIKEPLYIYL